MINRQAVLKAIFSFLIAALFVLPFWPASSEAQEEPPSLDPTPSSERYDRWLEDVAPLMNEAEREVFLDLEQNYQRDDFIEKFWRIRDPFPRTVRNEFRERWEERVVRARELFDGLEGDRSRMLLLFGEPSRRQPISCAEVLRTLDVWIYDDGSDRLSGSFSLVFIGYRAQGYAPHPLWQPEDGLRALLLPGGLATASDPQLAQIIANACSRGEELLGHLASSVDLKRFEEKVGLFPQPGEEWVRSFRARSTQLADDAEPFTGQLHISYPGRHQSRTVVQGVLEIPKEEAEIVELGEHRAFSFLIDGEILRQGELFDQFRYRFDFPEADLRSEAVPLVVQRYLRPGQYQWIIKVEDLNSKRAFREERELEVPRVDPQAKAPVAVAEMPGEQGEVNERFLSGSTVTAQLDEANASIATGDQVIEILPMPELLTVGKLRVMAKATGEGIERVAFYLNHRPVMRKSRPPYSVELDLGDKPDIHHVRVEALGDQGKVLASDETMINAGPHRFAVRLLEPQRGRTYRQSVRTHAEVEVPEGERLDRVELYLNETKLATLYQPPYEQPVLLPEGLDLAYVRAVAFLESGIQAEDVTFINAPDFIEELDIHFVELFTSAVDRKGQFVEGLTKENFRVLEDGEEQEIRRFEAVKDLPIHAGIVLDTSLSMIEELRQVERAAYRFLETVLTPRDRAAVITFSDEPQLAVRFTHDKAVLAGGLASLTADGETALYDSIIFSLHYFSGLKGKRAIVLLTDGEDSRSTYAFQDAIDFARRTGVAVYVIGLNLGSNAREVRMLMQRLAHETGGEYYSVANANQLGKVYEKIQVELRSQYLIGYQSSQGNGDPDRFRRIEIKLDQKGLEAKTLRGYFP